MLLFKEKTKKKQCAHIKETSKSTFLRLINKSAISKDILAHHFYCCLELKIDPSAKCRNRTWKHLKFLHFEFSRTGKKYNKPSSDSHSRYQNVAVWYCAEQKAVICWAGHETWFPSIVSCKERGRGQSRKGETKNAFVRQYHLIDGSYIREYQAPCPRANTKCLWPATSIGTSYDKVK